jgi:hypothetical protein
MKLSHPITFKPRVWMFLDVAAVLAVLGGFLTIYAIQSGAWNPLGSVTIGIWPWLLCSLWVGIASGVAVLLGLQFAAAEARHTTAAAAPTPEVHQTAVKPTAAAVPVSVAGPREEQQAELVTVTEEHEEEALVGAER